MFISESTKQRFVENAFVTGTAISFAGLQYTTSFAIFDFAADVATKVGNAIVIGTIFGGATTLFAAAAIWFLGFAKMSLEDRKELSQISQTALIAATVAIAYLVMIPAAESILYKVIEVLAVMAVAWTIAFGLNAKGENPTQCSLVMMPFGVGLIAALFMLKGRDEETA